MLNGSDSLRREPRGALTKGAFAAWLLVMLALLLIGVHALPGAARMYDLRSFYAAGYLLRHTPARLYDLEAQNAVQNLHVRPARQPLPFYHPAYEALLYVPLSALPYSAAYLAYMFWNGVLLAAVIVFAPAVRSQALARVPRSALVLAFLPALFCVLLGQNSLLYLLLLCAVWRKLSAGRFSQAGFLLAIGLFKLTLSVPLAILLGVRYGWRFLRGFVPAALAVAMVCVALTGIPATLDFLRLLRGSTLLDGNHFSAQTAMASWPAQMPSLNGLLYICGARLLSSRPAFAVNVAASAVTLAAGIRLVRRAQREEVAFAAAALCALLLGYHVFIYDYAVLLLPMFLLQGRTHSLYVFAGYLLLYVLFVVAGTNAYALAAALPLAFLALEVWPGDVAHNAPATL